MREQLPFLERNRIQSVNERIISFRRNFLREQTDNAIINLDKQIARRKKYRPFYEATNDTFEPVIYKRALEILAAGITKAEVPDIPSSTLEGTDPLAHIDNFNLQDDQIGNWDLTELIEDIHKQELTTGIGATSVASDSSNKQNSEPIRTDNLNPNMYDLAA